MTKGDPRVLAQPVSALMRPADLVAGLDAADALHRSALSSLCGIHDEAELRMLWAYTLDDMSHAALEDLSSTVWRLAAAHQVGGSTLHALRGLMPPGPERTSEPLGVDVDDLARILFERLAGTCPWRALPQSEADPWIEMAQDIEAEFRAAVADRIISHLPATRGRTRLVASIHRLG